MAAKNKSNELKISRVYDAPVRAVWDAWTDPEQVAKWWGPRGFTLTTHSKDLRPGGQWLYTMHGPDGTDWPNVTLYHEVVECEKLVYDHGGSDDRPPMFMVTVSFSEVQGKTKMEMTMAFQTPEAAEEARKFIKQAGGESTWDRLAEYLAKERAGVEKFVINRSFDAPINTLFELWTNPHHLVKWSGLTGSEMGYIRVDIRTGGSAFYWMTLGETKMFGRVQYLQVEKPHRLVYTQQFCDSDERPSRHPFAPTWPVSMQTTVEFTEEGPERTRVTLTWQVVGEFTREELETFVKARGGMSQGWTGSFDKLEEFISTLA